MRLEKLEASSLKIAKWLKAHPDVELVLHPALPDCTGHEIWKRDFTGSASVFSFVFKENITPEKVTAFVNSLKFFKLGFSWGGTQSLSMIYPGLHRPNRDYKDRLVRLNIGLEEPEDLINDIATTIEKIRT